MAGLQDILSDPNYVNANAATKAAIFDKFAPLDSNFTKANPETQNAIRTKFGVSVTAEPEVRINAEGTVIQPDVPLVGGQMREQQDARQNVGAELPAFAKTSPRLYEAAVKARQMLGPTVEAGGAIGGGLIGTAGGPPGIVGGAGLGYGIAKEILTAADVALGLRQQRQGAQQYEEPIRNVLEGATYEAGGQAAGPIIQNALSATGRGITNVLGKIQDVRQLPKQLAADIARKTFETPANLEAGRNALQQAVASGQTVTPAQALAQGKVISPTTQAMLEDVTTRIAPMAKETKAAGQLAGRQSTIKAITPDIDEAIKVRSATADPLWKAADESVAVVDDTLKNILDRMPKGTLESAAEIAKIEGKSFPSGVDVGSSLTGQQMHYIKRGLADKAYGSEAATGLGADAQRAVKGLLDEYVTALESKIPVYGEARRTFSDLSAPVNQAQVLNEMVSVLTKPGGGERITPFLNVLGRGETAMLKRAGGRGAPRYTALEEVLSPEQIGVVRNVAKELETNAAVKQEITLGQQRFSDLMKEVIPSFSLPNVFNIFATTANKVLDVVGVKAGKKTMAELEKAALTAKSFDDLLGTLPATERNRVLSVIRDPDTWKGIVSATSKAVPKEFRGPGILGAKEALNVPEMPVNALAPSQQQNQNALAK